MRVTPGTDLPKPVLINLESRGSVVNTVYTDGEGRFGFNGLVGNIYHIKIDDDTYLPANETVKIDGKTKPVAMVSILLNPKNPERIRFTYGDGRQSPSDQLRGSGEVFPPRAIKEFDAGVKADAHHEPDDAIKHYEKL